MVMIKIDDKDYDLDALSQEAKTQLASLQFCDTELRGLQAKASAIQLARARYAEALKEALNKPSAASGAAPGASRIIPAPGAAEPDAGSVADEKKKKGFFGGLFGKK